MIGRAEERSAQSAARDVGKISFDRLGLSDVDLVKILLGEAKRASLEKVAIGRDRAAFAKLKERNVRRRDQLHIVTGSFFQKQSCEREKRIGNGAGFNLGDNIFKRRDARQKFNGNRRQWLLDRRRTVMMSILAMPIVGSALAFSPAKSVSSWLLAVFRSF